jgi:hypothetical protein
MKPTALRANQHRFISSVDTLPPNGVAHLPPRYVEFPKP